MAQLSVRADDALVARVRRAAGLAGLSTNQYVVNVLGAATDPGRVADSALRLRQRLAHAGLLEQPVRTAGSRPAAEEVAGARRRAGTGTALSDVVSAERR